MSAKQCVFWFTSSALLCFHLHELADVCECVLWG